MSQKIVKRKILNVVCWNVDYCILYNITIDSGLKWGVWGQTTDELVGQKIVQSQFRNYMVTLLYYQRETIKDQNYEKHTQTFELFRCIVYNIQSFKVSSSFCTENIN